VRHPVDLIGRAAQPWGYVVVFLTVTLEASAFVGLIFPGETALLVGGFLASQHKLNLWMLMVLGVAGAVIGDSIGYEVGRHLGGRLQQSRLGRKVGDERWERARDTLRRYGGKAVLIGRWVGVLRALVPPRQATPACRTAPSSCGTWPGARVGADRRHPGVRRRQLVGAG
jgi:membrane protein DedA with SNARE-associated domain